MDHNKHVIEGNLEEALVNRDRLDLCKAIHSHTGASPGMTFFQGSKPINCLWVSSDLDISNAVLYHSVTGLATTELSP
jgi:hypothetical protein